MRADRLISIIMLLESKISMTARELARELEVTERTIYRDIEALCSSGVPVYGSTGHDGGYRLMEGYKSNLNGLNRDEIMALLSLSIPDQFEEIGLGSKLKSSILKIRSSYSNLVKEKEPVSRVYIDSTGWREVGKYSSHLNVLYNAIQNSRALDISYSLPSYPVGEFIRTVCPIGLVIKENVWYLVYLYQGKNWVIKVSRIIRIKEIEEGFDYPGDFNLQAFWKEWCRDLSMQFDGYSVRVMVPEALKSTIALNIKESRASIYSLPLDYKNTEWVEVKLFFDSFEEARSKLLALGGAVRVIEPIALKYSILDYAEQILALKD